MAAIVIGAVVAILVALGLAIRKRRLYRRAIPGLIWPLQSPCFERAAYVRRVILTYCALPVVLPMHQPTRQPRAARSSTVFYDCKSPSEAGAAFERELGLFRQDGSVALPVES
jgi:hypothetical protein